MIINTLLPVKTKPIGYPQALISASFFITLVKSEKMKRRKLAKLIAEDNLFVILI